MNLEITHDIPFPDRQTTPDHIIRDENRIWAIELERDSINDFLKTADSPDALQRAITRLEALQSESDIIWERMTARKDLSRVTPKGAPLSVLFAIGMLTIGAIGIAIHGFS